MMSLALWAAVTGCGPDPAGKFEEFLVEAEPQPRMDMGADKEDMPPVVPDVPPGTDLPVEPPLDLNGTALMAISTAIDPDLPMQFLSTVVQRNEGDRIFLDIEMQPLSLAIGKVTTPREPVGEKLVYKDVEVVDGKFSIDAGLVMVTGMANPVTNTDIEATLMLEAKVIDSDFLCGTVSGELMKPLAFDLTGSTLAAVRLEDPKVLPSDVVINCKRETRTDK